jgi:hypothetical protein
MVSKRFEATQCTSLVFLSFKMRTLQTDQRGKTEIAIHPIENDTIPAVAETSLMLLSCSVPLYSIAYIYPMRVRRPEIDFLSHLCPDF